MTKQKRPFSMISKADNSWLRQQEFAVVKLWLEVVDADPFGDGIVFESELPRATFFKAKKKLEQAGMCRFEILPGRLDARCKQWLVTNLHGSNLRDYWMIESRSGDSIVSDRQESEILETRSRDSDSRLLDSISLGCDPNSSEALSASSFQFLSDFNQTKPENLTIMQNPSVSLVSDSLRSTQSTESSSKENPSSSNETTPCPENLFYHQPVFLEEDTRTDYWHGKETENRSSVQPHEGSVMSYITPQISRTFSAAEQPREAPSPDPTIQSHTNHPQDALSDPLAASDETLDLEVELECLRETVEGVLWDINGTISPGLPEVLERFKSFATTTRLLPVSDNCPEYERMNGFVEMKNYEVVMSLSTNGEIKRVTLGRISYQ